MWGPACTAERALLHSHQESCRHICTENKIEKRRQRFEYGILVTAEQDVPDDGRETTGPRDEGKGRGHFFGQDEDIGASQETE